MRNNWLLITYISFLLLALGYWVYMAVSYEKPSYCYEQCQDELDENEPVEV